MLDEPLLVLIRYLSETLNRANPPCKLLMLESYGNETHSIWRLRTHPGISVKPDNLMDVTRAVVRRIQSAF